MLSHFLRAATPKAVTTSYIGTASSGTSASSFTFSSQGIGTAATDRIVFVAVGTTGGSGVNVNSVTIGGTTATLINAGTLGFGTMACAYLAVSTGTTATIVVNLSGSMNRCAIDVYSVYGSTSTPSDTALTLQPTSATTISNNVDIPINSVCIYTYVAGGGYLEASYSSATEDYDGTIAGSTSRSGARKSGQALNHTETLTLTSTKSNMMFAATVWSP